MPQFENFVWKTAISIGAVSLALMIVPSPIVPGLAQTSAERPPGARFVATAPAGQVNRYVIPNYISQAQEAPARSTTVVSILNNTDGPCDAAVAFQYMTETTDICVISLTIPAKESRTFCSREVGAPSVSVCVITCNPPLVFNTGHAYVRSTAGPRCKKISVDAQLYYTSDLRDEFILSQSQLTVTDLEANRGD